jgi:L-rhamnose-H+ transport protein
LGTNPFIGIVYHWLGGFASATNFIPFRAIKRWSWEIYWIIQGFAAWILAPIVLAYIFVPNLFHILHTAYASHPADVRYAFLFGALWGIGGLTFGLAIRYLGIALGYAIALGLCTAFGTLIPPIYSGQIVSIMHVTSGQVILVGVAVCLIAVAVNGAAGWSKEKETTLEEKAEAGESDYSFGKGIAVAIFAGIMSSFFAFGLTAGKPIGDIAKTELLANHRLDLWQNLPILIIVLWGGFLTNFVWSAVLILKNRSIRQFAGEPGYNPMRATHASGDTLIDFEPVDGAAGKKLSPKTLVGNYIFAAMAGIIWYFQFFFYSMGQTKMGKYDFSSWTLHMASIIIFATLWGVALREWRGTSLRTRVLVTTGLITLVGSTIIVGFGNYLRVGEDAAAAAKTAQHSEIRVDSVPLRTIIDNR